MAVVHQVVTDQYALYQGDCCEVLPTLPDESVGFSIFSPPFNDLYSYSDDERDMGNAKDYGTFFDHFDFLVGELKRLLMPGRNVAVHCMDLPVHKRDGYEIGLRDFPGDLIRSFEKHGFVFHARFCVWKDPLIAATRTKAIGLAHKQICKDSAICRTGIPDYILVMRKPGENPKPIANPLGFKEYHGARDIPRNLDAFVDSTVPEKNKRSHWIWQQYASPVWFDVRQTRVLPFRQAKDGDDTKHICPLQLDVIERSIALWTTKHDIVLTPFMGVGSEVFVAVKNGRRGVGVELKRSYFRQAVKNVERALEAKLARFEI